MKDFTIQEIALTSDSSSNVPPSWRGTATVGSTLVGLARVWTPSSVKLDYQWNADGAPIAGATSK